MALPQWLTGASRHPGRDAAAQLDKLVGFVMLFDPPPPFDLTYEDRDLLKTVGRHVATHIAQHDADRKLAESRQFEAYNRLTAFMMHDLKNSVAQLKLIVANAARHKSNPAFIEDAIDTIANAVERMTRLIEQLRGTPDVSRNARLDLGTIVQEAVGRTRDRSPEPRMNVAGSSLEIVADGERLVSVLEHVIRNAQDSVGGAGNGEVSVTLEQRETEAEIAIADTGAGMDARFVRERLFRPFDSTKGSKGMGIGAYQAREYVRALGGDVEVQSSPGRGTRFLIKLPLAPERRVESRENASLSS